MTVIVSAIAKFFDDPKNSNLISISFGAYNFEKIPHKLFKVMYWQSGFFWLEALKQLNHSFGIYKSLMLYIKHDYNMLYNEIEDDKKARDIFRTEHQWDLMI